MALVTCPACGAAATDADGACPTCATDLADAGVPGMPVAGTPPADAPAAAVCRGRGETGEPAEAPSTRLFERDDPTDEMSGDASRDVTRERAEPESGRDGRRPRPDGGRAGAAWPVVAGGAAVLVLALVLLALLPMQARPHAVAKPAPTATATLAPTATPTPSPTATPTPKPLPGFAYYVDSPTADAGSGPDFAIQYPATWTATRDTNLGVTFAQSDPYDPNVGFRVQVYHPDASGVSVSNGEDPSAVAASWVDKELSGLQQIWGADNFARVPGPIPPVSIGGQMWQSGAAEIGPSDGRFRMQSYATVYNGKPYVINVLAPDGVFDQGEQEYFGPMLSTFKFLPPAA